MYNPGRSPHGERGLKSYHEYYPHCYIESLPSRGAWIEIWIAFRPLLRGMSRSPHGERGLKSPLMISRALAGCRSPHGERGLKCCPQHIVKAEYGRSPHGERGLKSGLRQPSWGCATSLPSRGAWIEIFFGFCRRSRACVAPLTGSVD